MNIGLSPSSKTKTKLTDFCPLFCKKNPLTKILMITYAFQAQNQAFCLDYLSLPKVHKEGVPLRPILSSIGTCGYNIAKFFVPYLEKLTTNEFTVKDSFTFAQEISSFQNSDNFVMASFNIKSLFTNIPLDETINIAANSLYSDNNSFLSLSITQFRKFLGLAVKNTLFHFNDKLYQQIDGVAPLLLLIFFFVFTRPYGFKIVLQTSNQLCIGDMLMIPSYYLEIVLTFQNF